MDLLEKQGNGPPALPKTYEIQDEIARGGMGIINRIVDQNLGRILAMKVLKSCDGKSAEKQKSIQEIFIAEARITASLEHPNIVPVHDLGILPDGKIYFTMKMVAGEDLGCILQKIADKEKNYRNIYTLHNLLTIFRKVCDALAFAHAHGIIHRDIKPGNIIVGNYGEVLLMDWGVAKVLDPSKSALGLKDADGTKVIGTPLYISPEQAKGENQRVDQRSDIYLLGGTLYHILTLYPPHRGNNLLTTLFCAQQGSFSSPHERSPERQIPLELSRIVMKAMARKQEDRYPTVEALCEDIDRFMAGTIVSKPILFKKGDFLIHEGEEGQEAYNILTGSAEVYQNMAGKHVLLTTLESGSIVGEMGLIAAAKRSADVVAKEDMEVLVIDQKLLQNALDRMPPWMEKIVSSLVNRLQTANQNIHPLKIGDPVYHVLNQLGILASLLAFQKGIPIHELDLSLDSLAQEIAFTLSLPLEKVKSIVTKLMNTEICRGRDENTFRLENFFLYCHVLLFLRSTLEIEQAIDWIGKLPPLDSASNIQRCQIAARLSPEIKAFLKDIPLYAKYIE